MSSGFAQIPPARRYVLRNAAWLMDRLDPAGDVITGKGDVIISDGRFESFGLPAGPDLPFFDMRGGLLLPGFVDLHTHLDKGHIWHRSANPDGTFFGALNSVRADRDTRWTADDLAARMNFSLRSAFAHGTVAVRTHLDSIDRQTAISWPVFEEMRAAWKDKITLQAVALFPIDVVHADPDEFRAVVSTVARYGGILGGVTYLGEPVTDATHAALDHLMQAAQAHGLDLDLHVDESAASDACSLEAIADAALRNRFSGKILCGHCCSLALADAADRMRVIDKLAQAHIAVVSLPMCNLYLQDRQQGRTPRWRGVAPLHELNAAGVTVMVASDNTRDPFYAYGDMDMMEVMREATRILHLDHPHGRWLDAATRAPAAWMGVEAGVLREGSSADCVLVSARNLNELYARPWTDRTVLRRGRAIDRTLPDYRELDFLAR